MTAVLALSVCLNVALAAALGVVAWRHRQFRKPFDPKVSVYVNARGWSGWVPEFPSSPDDVRAVRHAKDAAVRHLSEVRPILNGLIHRGIYVRVCRVVHPEHWKEARHGG